MADPTTVTGLRGRWRASTIAGPPADAAAVSSWTDTSANARHFTQATTANQPVYRTSGAFLPNGKAVVEFTSASAQNMVAAAAPDNGATTRFHVFRAKTLPGDQALTSASAGYEPIVNVSGKVRVDIPNVAALTFTPQTATIAVNTWYVIAFDSNGSNSHHTYVNGTLDGTSTTAGTATATTNLSTGGRGWQTGSSPVNGYLAEILDYSAVLSAADRATVDTYLQDEYGITVSDYVASVIPNINMAPRR